MCSSDLGVGEMLQPVAPLACPAVLLVHPGVSVSTKWVYQSLDLTSQALDDSFQRSAGGGRSCPFVNDLEPVTVSRYPVVGELKAEMAGLGAEPALISRLELRSVDPMANPYIAMAVLLEVGLHGIENKIQAPAPVEENIYVMSAEERKEAGITDLPSTLHNAVKALTEDEVVKGALGNHIYTSFIEAKRIEWASYATFVSQWEIDNYLDLY